MKHNLTRFLAVSLFLALASVARAEETKAVLYTGKLSALSIPADALGVDWTGPSGLVANDFKDLSNCPIEALPIIAALKKASPISVLGCADFTYRKKANPFHQVTLRVFVFDSPKSCANWCKKKYGYEGWERHYAVVSDVPYKAVDSTQMTKRAIWFGNIWMTSHTLTKTTDHLKVLDLYMSKITTLSGEGEKGGSNNLAEGSVIVLSEKTTGRVAVDTDGPQRRGDEQVLADLKSCGAEVRTNAILDDTADDVIRFVEVRFREDSWAASSSVVSSLQHVEQNVTLDFYGIRLSDDELRKFRGWTNLISISFKACKIEDDSLRHIATLPKLRGLVLQSGGGLTNAALAHFHEHRGLRSIMLEGHGFTDEAVRHLKKMQEVKHISLSSHGFTANGVAELKKALPSAYISVSEPSFDDLPQTTE